jgi:hypothetical protein
MGIKDVKKLTTVVVWIVAVLLGVSVTRELVARSRVKGPNQTGTAIGPVTVTPYTVLYDLRRDKSPADPAKSTAIKLIAVRADGSRVQQLEVLDGRVPVSSRLIQLSSGITITTNDILERKYTRTSSNDIRAALRDPKSQCLKTFAGTPVMRGDAIAGEDMIAGYRAVQIKTGDATLWFAPDLGCSELRSRVAHPSGEVLDTTVTTVRRGNPDPALFEVGAKYTEVPRERLRDGR